MIRLCAFSDEAGSSLQAQIDALLRNGIGLMEIRMVDGENIANISLEKAEQIRNTLKANGIRVWALGSPLGKVSMAEGFDFAKTLAQCEHLCKLAKVLETDKIRMFSFYDAYDKKDQVVNCLRQMVELAAGYGVMLCHENEKSVYGDVVKRVQVLMEEVPGLRFVYDPANYIQCNEKSEHSLPTLHGSTLYFHIKDVIFETQELVPAGYGDGNIPALVEMIQDDKVLTLEPHLKVFDGYASFDAETMKNKFPFASNTEAFDAAVKALKDVLVRQGYKEQNGGFEKV